MLTGSFLKEYRLQRGSRGNISGGYRGHGNALALIAASAIDRFGAAERIVFLAARFLSNLPPSAGVSPTCYTNKAPVGFSAQSLRGSMHVQFLRDVLTPHLDFALVFPGGCKVVSKLHP